MRYGSPSSVIERWTSAIAVIALFVVAPAGLLAQQEGSSRWERSIRAFEESDKEAPPPKGAILFVGSSSIRGWDVEKYFRRARKPWWVACLLDTSVLDSEHGFREHAFPRRQSILKDHARF